METQIVTTAFGDRRKQLRQFIDAVRQYTTLHIHIITNGTANCLLCDVEQRREHISYQIVDSKWNDHKRYGYRNSNWWRFKILQEIDADFVMYMDNDIRLLSLAYVQGFQMAKLFGMCMPLSPRVFVHSDAVRGVDAQVRRQDLSIPFAPVCNPGFFFASVKDERTQLFVKHFLATYDAKPGRGPLGVWLAAESCGYHPHVLPHQWLVCDANAQVCANYPYGEVKPIAAHWSGRTVKKHLGNQDK